MEELRELDITDSAEQMTAEFVIEHSQEMIPQEDGSFEFRTGVLADHDHFYPGATLDEYGVSTGGWPTDAELEANRRPGGRMSQNPWYRRG